MCEMFMFCCLGILDNQPSSHWESRPDQVRCRNSPMRGWGWDPRRQSTWESQSGRFRLPLRSGPSQIIFGKVSSRREKRALGPGPGRWIPWTRQIHGCHNERFQQTLLFPAVFRSQNVNNNRWPSVYSDFSIYKTILGTQLIIMNIIFLRFTVIRFILLQSIVVFT